MAQPLQEPLDRIVAKSLIREILATGTVRFSSHAEREMRQDLLDTGDCLNVLRGGWVGSIDLERGTWRYQVCTNRMTVVVAFRSATMLTVVTAWRIAP
jgi:hypothetical protein